MEEPVFIFAASWRTGSTLLQRVVNASSDVFIWGEPRFLAQAQTLYVRMMDIAARPGQAAGNLSDIPSGAWIPTVFPGKERVQNAFAHLFCDLFAYDARAARFPRWGFKEVRPGAVKAAQFLHEIFPGSRFVFLVRHPMDTYHSLRNMDFFRTFKNPYLPANAWATNASGFLDVTRAATLPAILIRYEDLIGDPARREEVLNRLCTHLRIRRTPEMDGELAVKSGHSNYSVALTPEDIAEVTRRTEHAARQCGYEL
jgi:hypothetical protein